MGMIIKERSGQRLHKDTAYGRTCKEDADEHISEALLLHEKSRKAEDYRI